MAAPTLNTARVLHTAIACRELYIGDETAEGTTVGKFGWGVTPVAPSSRVTFTQTYALADPTVPDATYTAPTATANTIVLSATNIASKTPSLTLTQSTATNPSDADFDQLSMNLGTAINTINTNLASTNTQLAALAADVILLKKALNSAIDALQALGFVL